MNSSNYSPSLTAKSQSLTTRITNEHLSSNGMPVSIERMGTGMPRGVSGLTSLQKVSGTTLNMVGLSQSGCIALSCKQRKDSKSITATATHLITADHNCGFLPMDKTKQTEGSPKVNRVSSKVSIGTLLGRSGMHESQKIKQPRFLEDSMKNPKQEKSTTRLLLNYSESLRTSTEFNNLYMRSVLTTPLFH